jgi:MbtH protein
MESNSEATPGTDESFIVVVNAEGQYSAWWEDRELPAGWQPAGIRGTRADCLAHIAEVWTDMRPASLRDRPDGGSATWES